METGSFKVNEISTVLGNLISTFNFFFCKHSKASILKL